MAANMSCVGCWKMNRLCFAGCRFQEVMSGGDVSSFEMESALDKFDVNFVDFCLRSFPVKADRVACLKSLSYERNKRVKHVLLGTKQVYDDLIAELDHEKGLLEFANARLASIHNAIHKAKTGTQRAYDSLSPVNHNIKLFQDSAAAGGGGGGAANQLEGQDSV